MQNSNGYKREGVQNVRAGRFETPKFINSNVGDEQNKTKNKNLEIHILDNSNSKEVSRRRKDGEDHRGEGGGG